MSITQHTAIPSISKLAWWIYPPFKRTGSFHNSFRPVGNHLEKSYRNLETWFTHSGKHLSQLSPNISTRTMEGNYHTQRKVAIPLNRIHQGDPNPYLCRLCNPDRTRHDSQTTYRPLHEGPFGQRPRRPSRCVPIQDEVNESEREVSSSVLVSFHPLRASDEAWIADIHRMSKHRTKTNQICIF